MRIAPEGWPFILAFWALELVLYAFAPLWAALLWLPVAVWVIAFFRDPVREGPRGDQLVIAPADGVVVSVVTVDEPDYVQERTQRVSIFMNVFNVHVNRYPMSGTLEYRHYNKGKFGHAGTEKASLENEQSTIGLRTARGKVLVRQIAGLVARRIVTDHQPGTAVRQAERMGLIRFGSRVDVFLPASARVLVHAGDKTVAGQTVVAQWD
ncbi:MAG: phosphatidylserine decarboxylase family protein [Gemmatimonadetes bacterium]|jgi:phosphatidylserine decarboxylase|nr:phosphatidylserine decarboxylase family protein [Gemmatimonadota bacterium]MBP9200163.1 phosphatidylserine decarboxylase family protein [Gemmatimonadales bacterium]MBK7348532.1 phosphatidylserine decarboxylase family protein [Gemmatimonadota bacterium]MBK7783160.1 phosphatidylserine decarboxylase family protein [Gemmatimonadota bacterium]MBK7924102.1 phosphatidylserine decarboxylase family protein [Gemmatimonadota bacterium]